jgi:hypothetical protein
MSLIDISTLTFVEASDRGHTCTVVLRDAVNSDKKSLFDQWYQQQAYWDTDAGAKVSESQRQKMRLLNWDGSKSSPIGDVGNFSAGSA